MAYKHESIKGQEAKHHPSIYGADNVAKATGKVPEVNTNKHPGFDAEQRKLESKGYSKKSAGAIIAKASRNASPAAKAANPNLKKVKGTDSDGD